MIGIASDPDKSVHILDVRDPYSPRFIADVFIPGFERVHNVFYDADSRFLYICNSRNRLIAIMDLTQLAADSPLQADITQARWILDLSPPPPNQGGTSASVFVHDVTVQNDRL